MQRSTWVKSSRINHKESTTTQVVASLNLRNTALLYIFFPPKIYGCPHGLMRVLCWITVIISRYWMAES